MAIAAAGQVGMISGRLGGQEFVQVGGKTVLKKKKGRQSRTSAATLRARAFQAESMQHWHALTDAEKLAWKIAAQQRPRPDRFGTPRTLNAMQLFLREQRDHTYCVEYWETKPPIISIGTVNVYDLELTAGSHLSVDYDNWWGMQPRRSISVFISRWRGNGSGGRGTAWRAIGPRTAFNGPLSFDAVLTSENVEFIEGEKVGIKFKFWASNMWHHEQEYGDVIVGA